MTKQIDIFGNEVERLYIALEENQKATKFWKDKSETIKAEAYKEFAEEIFELFPADKCNTVISRVTVKHILKERELKFAPSVKSKTQKIGWKLKKRNTSQVISKRQLWQNAKNSNLYRLSKKKEPYIIKSIILY